MRVCCSYSCILVAFTCVWVLGQESAGLCGSYAVLSYVSLLGVDGASRPSP